MPAGVSRVDVAMVETTPLPAPVGQVNSALGLGIFDHRGPGYQSPGFRGIYGEERNEFFLTQPSLVQRSVAQYMLEALHALLFIYGVGSACSHAIHRTDLYDRELIVKLAIAL